MPPLDPSPLYLGPVYDGDSTTPKKFTSNPSSSARAEFVATTVAQVTTHVERDDAGDRVRMTSAAADIGPAIAAPLEQAISYLRDALVMLGALGPFTTKMQTAKNNCAIEINRAIKLIESL